MTAWIRHALIAISAVAGLTGCSSGRGEAAGALPQSIDTDEYAYAFEPTGLSTSVGSKGSSYAIERHGDVLTAGRTTYRFDALGRIAAIDDLVISYGPDGQIAHATRGNHTVAYRYDEDGQRILESVDDRHMTASVDDRTVTANDLVEPVRAGGQLVGMVRNGNFSLLATDARGTVQADLDGTPRVAGPFGERDVHPDVATAIDYAAKGWDAHLHAVRMGVRDYDARIDRFLQPDPLYLEHPEKCIERIIDCNLYTYARNNPVQIVDPSGKDGISIGVFVEFGKGKDGLLDPRLPMAKLFGKDWIRIPQASKFQLYGTIAAGSREGEIERPSDFWGTGDSASMAAPVADQTGSDNVKIATPVSIGPGRGASRPIMRTNTSNIFHNRQNWIKR